MAVQVIELAASRSFGVGNTEGSGRRLYLARDPDGAEDNITAITLAIAAVAPFYWNNMSRQEFQAEHKGGNVYQAEVPYKYTAQTGGGDGAGSGTLVGVAPDPTQPPTPGTGPGGGDPSSPPPGPMSENERLYPNVSVEVGGKPPRLYTSLNTYASGGYGGATPVDYQGAIEVNEDGKVEGVDVPEPDLVVHQDFTFDYVTWAYVYLLKEMVWRTNIRPWSTFPASEVVFMGASLKSDNQGRVTNSMRFGLSKSRVIRRGEIRPGVGRIAEGEPGLPNGPIDVPGWHWLWVSFKPEVDAAAKRIAVRPFAFYIEQILDQADFRLLGIGG